MVGGTFWSGLLLLLNADDSFIGTASMIGTAANMLQLFAPLILERFPRRRTMLTVLRAVMYLIDARVQIADVAQADDADSEHGEYPP